MDEKTFIYQRLNFLSTELENTLKIISKLLDNQEKLQESILKLNEKVDKVTSPEYIQKVNEHIDAKQLIKKIDYLKGLTK